LILLTDIYISIRVRVENRKNLIQINRRYGATSWQIIPS